MTTASYLELAQTGTADSATAIAPKVTTQIQLDGDALDNVHGNLYPIDVAGDGRFAFLHFNGYRYMRVYDQAGNICGHRVIATGA